ncbi:fimbrial protein [Acinetobacter sp.]|uniref:fimbrial protein n=1 Tax=Acinetobacter sp. TaxID=472 RepID=UPI003B003E7C
MKKFTLPTLAMWALLLASSHVFAVDGKITVNGAVTDGTCTLRPTKIHPGTGMKNIIIPMAAVPKSSFTATNTLQGRTNIFLDLVNGAGDYCDEAQNIAFKGIHLSPISATDLDESDKTLLINKATGASVKNPVFIQLSVSGGNVPVNLSQPWNTQGRNAVYGHSQAVHVSYQVNYISKTGIVDAQSVTARVNYTLHYN